MAASLCLLGLMMALYHAFFLTGATPEQALRLVTRNRVSITNPMPISYRGKIAKIPGVRAVTVMQWFGGVYVDPKYVFARMAVEPEQMLRVYPEYKIIQGSAAQFVRDRQGCMIGKDLAAKFKLKPGDRMPLVGDIFPVTLEFIVSAIYDLPIDNESMYFNLEYLSESIDAAQRDSAGIFVVLVDKPENLTGIGQAVDAMFANSPVETKTESEKAFQVGFLSFLGNIKVFLMSICGAVTFTILLVTANTMAMSVRERAREVGVLKTLGFTNSEILGMVLGEAALLSFIGGVIGCAMAQGGALMIRQMPAMIGEFKTLTILPPVAAVLILISVLMGLISAFVPAWHASRTSILDSLRYVG